MILRGSMQLGVVETNELTAVYRRWDRGESSYTEHDELVWRESEALVLEELSSSSLVLPGRDLARIREVIAEHDEWKQTVTAHRALIASRPWRWSRPLRVLIRFASAGRQALAARLRRLQRRGD